MAAEIKSVDDYVRWVFEAPKAEGVSAFYRGHSKADTYKLEPTVLRNTEALKAEPRRFRELMIASPVEFSADLSTFEKLARMQHYRLPTRLLDTSTNPLIALYFACKSNDKAQGEVIRLSIAQENVKFYDSDTVSCLSNLALLAHDDKNELNTRLQREAFNESLPVTKLLHFIKGEKPYFRDFIDPADMDRVLCVRGRHSSERIAAQAGAFLLFGHNAKLPETGNHEISVQRVRIADGRKAAIMEQLDTLAINAGTAFQSLEQFAEHIASR